MGDRDNELERAKIEDRTTRRERTKSGEWLDRYLNTQARSQRNVRLMKLKSTVEQLKSVCK